MVCPNGRVFDLFARISIDLSDFDRGLNEASNKFKSFSNNLSKVGSGMEDLLSPAVDGFKAVEGVGKKAGSAISTGLKGFAAASTAVAGFGTAAVNSGMSFDSSMSKVQAISGATGDELQSLRDKALEMGAKSKFSASEAADALTYMGMAGWKTGDMLGGIEGIMNLAAASGEDLASTSDIVTNALTAFGMSADKSGYFANILAAASSNANTDVHMMGESFKYAAPVMGTLGYTAADTALALGLMGNNGIQASMAGTTLKTAMLNMASPTKAMKGVMDQYGISLTNTSGEMYSLGEIMIQLREKMGGLDETTKAAAASTLFGKEAAAGMMAIINAAPEDFEKLDNSIMACNAAFVKTTDGAIIPMTQAIKEGKEWIEVYEGAAARMAATMEDNLQGDITKLGSAFESLQIAISDSLTPTLREFAQFGQKAMAGLLDGFQGDGLHGFAEALSGVVTQGVTMLAQQAPEFAHVAKTFIWYAAKGLLNAKDDILEAGNQIVLDLVGGLQTFPMYYGEQLREVGSGIIELVARGFSMAGDAISWHIGEFIPLIAEGFLTYHETLFTVGMDILGAIGQGIIDNKDEIQSMASETITNMVTALRDNAPAIIEGGIALLEALVGAIEENLPLILETGAVIIGKLIEGITTASPGVQAIISTAVLPHIFKIIEVIGSIGGAVSNVAGLVGNAINTIMGIGSKLMGGIQALFGLIMAHPVIAVITAIIAALVLLWTNCEEFRDIVKGVLEAVGGFFKSAYEVITGAFSGAVDFFGGIIDGIKGAFDGIGEFLGGLFQAAWELVQAAWGAAVEFFTAIGDGIRTAFEAVTDFLGEAFSAAWEVISGVWDVAVGFFSAIWEAISGAAETAAGVVGDVLSAAWDAITSVWDGAVRFFGGIWDGIKGVFSDVWSHFQDIGSNIVNGIKDGIAGAWDAFMGWLDSKVGGIVNGVKSMLGIHSPSTVFAGIGENMALGLAEGWGDQYSSIKRQIENGMNFEPASVGINASYSAAARYGAQEAAGRPGAGWGNTTVNIYSPEAVDGAEAARVWKKEAQKMAIAYV